MDLISYIDKGGIIVYILIALNIIGFTIILWKFFTLPRKNAMISKRVSLYSSKLGMVFDNYNLLKNEIMKEHLV